MQHINSERIAALADEPATLIERTHLTECVSCNAELAAAQRLVHMALTDVPAIERPITSWERLGPALRAEGLVRIPMDRTDVVVATDVTSISTARRAATANTRWMMQAAAGIFLLVGGAVVGRASVGMPSGTPGGAEVAANTTHDTNFASTTAAMNALQRASNDYQRAVAYLAVNDSNVTITGRDAAELYQARLDVLDKTVAATQAALVRAPRDPVLNNYYLQSVGARDLTLRQLGNVMPVSMTKGTRF